MDLLQSDCPERHPGFPRQVQTEGHSLSFTPYIPTKRDCCPCFTEAWIEALSKGLVKATQLKYAFLQRPEQLDGMLPSPVRFLCSYQEKEHVLGIVSLSLLHGPLWYHLSLLYPISSGRRTAVAAVA